MLGSGIDPRTGIFDTSALPEHRAIERVPPHWKNTDSWPFLATVRQETPTTPPELWHDLESMTLWVPLYVVLHRFAPPNIPKPTASKPSTTTPASATAPTIGTVDYDAVRALFVAHWFIHYGWFRNPEGGMYCTTSGHISGASRKLAWLEEGQYRAFYRDAFEGEGHGSADGDTGGGDKANNDTESNTNDDNGTLRRKHPATLFFTHLCAVWASVYMAGVGGIPEIRGLRRSYIDHRLARNAVACGVGRHEPLIKFCREVLEGWDKSGEEDGGKDKNGDQGGDQGQDEDEDRNEGENGEKGNTVDD